MGKRAAVLLVGIGLLLGLAACDPAAPSPSGSPPVSSVSESPTATAAPTPVATAIEVSLDNVAVVDQNGAAMTTAVYTDPAAVLALLSGALGSTPTPTHYEQYSTDYYDWGAVTMNYIADSFSIVSLNAATAGGLALRTDQGIAVGAPVSAVTALSPYLADDFDGDGQPDFYGLEQRNHPGMEALTPAGGVGQDYIIVRVEGGAVSSIGAPSNDYSDV